ncbi:MAG: RtcB family protein [Euryarchaeota archaeon]|nr:RtcB family protein [Euryarchaeota archaeon]
MEIKRIAECIWEIPPTEKEGMLVPARIYATEKLLREMDQGVFEQVTNVACLPGIQRFSYCMPDGHWGYGFPIGGVAAFDPETGVISPGGIGFDINCGMRLVRTNLTLQEVRPRIKELVDALFRSVPAGVGSKGMLKLSPGEFKEMTRLGARWCVERGYGWERDLERIEEYGCIKGADPEKVSDHALKRGIGQLGTLGSGNHYLEVQVARAAEIYDPQTANAFGIGDADQIFVMFHCGSRGFGHQVATDYLRVFDGAMKRYGITVRDRELACAPFRSPEGQDYYKAMACAANNAFANRQMILHRVRETFSQVFGRDAEALGMDVIYDVAHNIAKVERHRIDGGMKDVVVHRKGATRCFGPGREELPPIYRDIGQPVILGGSMETGSYVLVGTERAMEETFGSTAHGSGRTMSRAAAKRKVFGRDLQRSLEERGIVVKAVSMPGLAEEAGFAYKNISEVVEALECAGITRKVVGLKPIGNVKG